MKTTGAKDGMYLMTHGDRAFILWRCPDGKWRAQELEYGNEEGLFWSPVQGEAGSLKAVKELCLSS